MTVRDLIDELESYDDDNNKIDWDKACFSILTNMPELKNV